MESGVADSRANLPSTKDLEKLQKESPGLFTSGYFVLAAIDGASSAQRTQATFALNVANGGDSGQIAIIPRYAIDTAATQQLAEDLQWDAADFASATKTEAQIGGPAGTLADFHTLTADQLAALVAVTSGLLALLLMAFLRSVALPLVVVACGLLTTAATFGVLKLLFQGSDPLLGGPGYIDPMSIAGIFAAIFGITMVYEVHMLQRAREAVSAGADTRTALGIGLRHTAAAATGAAIAMISAIIPFVASGLAEVREFGIGIGLAIMLDALIVRPVLLPAAIEVLSRLHIPLKPLPPTHHVGGSPA
jgi:putative drug exporter of the RND superfamily